jgi:hypothetical protein
MMHCLSGVLPPLFINVNIVLICTAHCGEGGEKCLQNFGGKPEGKRSL